MDQHRNMRSKCKVVYLKGHNQVQPDSWRGMDITLNYVGNLNNKQFGVRKTKITMNEAIHINNKINVFHKFHNSQLKQLSNVSFNNHLRFEELPLCKEKRNNNYYNSNKEKLLKYKTICENNIIDMFNEMCLEKINNKKNSMWLPLSPYQHKHHQHQNKQQHNNSNCGIYQVSKNTNVSSIETKEDVNNNHHRKRNKSFNKNDMLNYNCGEYNKIYYPKIKNRLIKNIKRTKPYINYKGLLVKNHSNSMSNIFYTPPMQYSLRTILLNNYNNNKSICY